MTAPGFGPDQAQHLLAAVHSLDTVPASLVRPALAVGLVGIALAVGLGQVGARMRLAAAPSVRPQGARPPGEGAAAVDAHGGGGRRWSSSVVRDAASLAGAKGRAETSYWGPVLLKRAVVLVHGPPKAGKSSLLTECLAHLLRGEDFLDWPTRRTSVVYFSEEVTDIWKGKAVRIAGDVEPACPWWQAWMPPGPVSWAPVRRPSVAPKWWRRWRGYRGVFHVEGPSIGHLRGVANLPKLMELADATARAVGAEVIVFDTLKHFCFEGQQAGGDAADRWIDALKALASRGPYCVVFVHHDNDNGTPLGSKTLYGGVDTLVHQNRIKGHPKTSPEREVEFDGRFALGEIPDGFRYRHDRETGHFVRVGSSAKKTEAWTRAGAYTPPTAPAGLSRVPLPLQAPTAASMRPPTPSAPASSLAPLPLPVLTPTPLRVLRPVPVGKDATRRDILAHLATTDGGPWKRPALRDTLVGAGLVARSAAYGHIAALVADGLLAVAPDGRLALKTEREATA